MGKDNELRNESSSIIEEVEEQLNKILQDKKAQVQKELDEKIRMEKEEAEKRISMLEEEVSEEKQSLAHYTSVLIEFESSKDELRSQIQGHLDKAIQFQTEIETMTSQTLDELKAVHSLNQKLDEINRQADEQVSGMKKSIEDKFGIIAPIPERNGHDDIDYNLEMELSKLNKIKDLLSGSEEPIIESTETAEPESIPEFIETDEQSPAESADGEAEASPEEIPAMDVEYGDSIKSDSGEIEATDSMEDESSMNEESVSSSTAEEAKDSASADAVSLDEYRKSEHVEGNGEIKYFMHEERIVIDAQSIFDALDHSLEEAKSLYMKLADLDSPKEQFFVKQDIIRHQDELRKMMLSYVRIAEKERCTFPTGMEEVLNLDVLKEILEKVSMENWSNESDYQAFEKYIGERKDAYSSLIDQSYDTFKAVSEELKMMD